MSRHYTLSKIMTVNGSTTVLPAEGETITVDGVTYPRGVGVGGLTVLPISGAVTFAVGEAATSSHKEIPMTGDLSMDADSLPLGAGVLGQVNLYAAAATTVQVMW